MHETSLPIAEQADADLYRLYTPTSPWLCSLDSLSLLSVQGPDSQQFLQAQTTNDINALQQHRWQLNGYCNPKGRLLAVFHVLRMDEQSYYLQMDRSMLEATNKRLTMYKLRSRLTLETKTWLCGLGLIGDHAADMIAEHLSIEPPQQGCLLDHNDCIVVNQSGFCRRYAIYAAADFIDAMRRQWSAHSEARPDTVWRLHTVLNGVPSIYPETSEKLVPQMVNLDVLRGLSFNKGCYPGQEVVARTYYRGKLKQRMYLFDCGYTDTAAGDPVFIAQFSEQQAAGMVVDAAADEHGRTLALISVRLQPEEPDPHACLHKAAGPAIQRLHLPYEFDD